MGRPIRREVAALDAGLRVGGLPLRLGGRPLRVDRYLLPLPVERGLLLDLHDLCA